MVIHLINKRYDDDLISAFADYDVQSVPFNIHGDCKVLTKKYIYPYVKISLEEEFKTSFRGHPLSGKKLNLPKGYNGIVLCGTSKSKPSLISKFQTSRLYVTKSFKSFIYWNWDKKVSNNDAFLKAFDWIDIAEAVYLPIVE